MIPVKAKLLNSKIRIIKISNNRYLKIADFLKIKVKIIITILKILINKVII